MTLCETPVDKKQAYWKITSTIKKRKLKCNGHAMRANNLSITIPQDTILGKERGRQEKNGHSGLRDHSQMPRHLHTTKTYGRHLSCGQ